MAPELNNYGVASATLLDRMSRLNVCPAYGAHSLKVTVL